MSCWQGVAAGAGGAFLLMAVLFGVWLHRVMYGRNS